RSCCQLLPPRLRCRARRACFLHGVAPHGHRHSFPTRRSSDLLTISPHDHTKVYVGSQFVHQTTDGGNSWQVISPDLTLNDKSRRSEEHTSELQSLRHLVCRLLLEKKNIDGVAAEALCRGDGLV